MSTTDTNPDRHDLADRDFLEAGEILSEVLTNDPDTFKDVIQKAGIKPRKAYYLVNIFRTFEKIPVPRDRLRKLGWTKLSHIEHQVTKGNYKALLKTAEEHTAKELEALMSGKEAESKGRSMVLYFSEEEHEAIIEVMQKFGARQGPRGFLDKEKALIAMAEALKG